MCYWAVVPLGDFPYLGRCAIGVVLFGVVLLGGICAACLWVVWNVGDMFLRMFVSFYSTTSIQLLLHYN